MGLLQKEEQRDFKPQVNKIIVDSYAEIGENEIELGLFKLKGAYLISEATIKVCMTLTIELKKLTGHNTRYTDGWLKH